MLPDARRRYIIGRAVTSKGTEDSKMSDGEAAPSSHHHWEYEKPAGRHTNFIGILRQHISLFCRNTMMSASAYYIKSNKETSNYRMLKTSM